MELAHLAYLELDYASIESVRSEAGVQFYGQLAGRFAGGRLTGDLKLTSLATSRPDGLSMPTMRGLLTTPDGGVMWMELDGLAALADADDPRAFITSAKFRTGDVRYTWVNSLFGLVEAELDPNTFAATGVVYECRPTPGQPTANQR